MTSELLLFKLLHIIQLFDRVYFNSFVILFFSFFLFLASFLIYVYTNVLSL